MLKDAPKFSVPQAKKIANEIFGLSGEATPLDSERDQNFRLTRDQGDEFVLKIANASEDLEGLDAQNQMMAHLNAHGVRAPQAVTNANGALISEVTAADGKTHAVRLVTFLPGRPYAELRRQPLVFFYNLGAYLGKADKALESFDHPAVQRDFYWDLAKAPQMIAEYRPLVKDKETGARIDHFMQGFAKNTAPLLPGLRRSAIHNDANNLNVIAGDGPGLYGRGQEMAGVIDFGDMVYSYTVGELAIAIAYAVLDKPNPLEIAAQITAGYHAEYPLTDTELQAVFSLAVLRLFASVCIAEHQISQRPGDEYLRISQGPIRRTLPQLTAIHPRFAEAALRQACGLTANPQTEQTADWLARQTFSPLVKPAPQQAKCLVFDLGIDSPLIEMDNSPHPEALTERIKAAEAGFGIGQYDEARLFSAKERAEEDTIHLGMDILAPAGTPVYAPLDAKIESLDSHGTVILAHQPEAGLVFYTLYRHLDAGSFQGWEAGQSINAGEKIGETAAGAGWAPHLHFQIVTDLLEMGAAFPAFCPASQREVWKAFSIDPNLVLKIPADNFPARPPSKTQTLAVRQAHIGPSVKPSYNTPIKIVRGWMQYLYDQDGRRYLDAYNNVPHVGHCHPKVVAAGQAQMGVLNTNTRYLHDHINRYAQRLTATLPDPLQVCYLVNSGSEANELALRLARAATGQRDTLVLEAAYHGNTTGMIDISPYKHDGPGGSGPPEWVRAIPIPDTYRGAYKADDPQAAQKYAAMAQDAIQQIEAQGRGLAAFIAETCPSVGGQIVMPDGYLAQVYEYVRDAGGVTIADEVQTGFGRTGTHFYAFEAHQVVPDILVLGKPIGNGHPLAVVVTTPQIAAAFDNGMEFFSTFGGNPVSCLVGQAVLDVLKEENLQQNALEIGQYLLDNLQLLKEKFKIVGDVRGSGLFLGVELVRDHQTLEPAGEEAAFIASRMSELGVLIGTDGPSHNVLKIRPPMPFSKDNADQLLAALEQILWEDFG